MGLVKRQKVAASVSDFNANLSVMGAFQIVEDVVTEYMGDLKIDGVTSKKLYNAVWVFAKTKIKFLDSIAWNSEYTVTAFISKISAVTINIDVGIKNTSNELCVYSRIELCALDTNSGRIRKVSTVGVNDSITTENPLLDISFTKKMCAEDLPIFEQVKVRFTNIDYVIHTNNKEYIRFLLNTYSVEDIRRKPIREMEIVYVNQSFENDILTIKHGNFDDKDIFVIQKEDKVIVKCEVLREFCTPAQASDNTNNLQS